MNYECNITPLGAFVKCKFCILGFARGQFHKLFCPYANGSHPTPNFYATKASQKLGIQQEWLGVGCVPVYEIDPLSAANLKQVLIIEVILPRRRML